MNPIKALYCRAVQFVLRAALPVLPYREPEVFHKKSIVGKNWLDLPMRYQPYTSRLYQALLHLFLR